VLISWQTVLDCKKGFRALRFSLYKPILWDKRLEGR
jgi:hypothetical protein